MVLRRTFSVKFCLITTHSAFTLTQASVSNSFLLSADNTLEGKAFAVRIRLLNPS